MKRGNIKASILAAIPLDILYFIFARFDLWINPWIRTVPMSWFNVLTTRHFAAWAITQNLYVTATFFGGALLIFGIGVYIITMVINNSL